MPSNTSTTLDRAIRILETLRNHPAGLTATELALLLDTPRAPLYRLFRTFMNYGWIRRDSGKRFHLGFGISMLAQAVADPIEEIAGELVQDLANQVGVSVFVVVESDDKLLTWLCSTPRAAGMYVTTPIGFQHPEGLASRTAVELIGSRSATETEEIALARELGYAATNGIQENSGLAVPLDLRILGFRACLLLVSVNSLDIPRCLPPLKHTAELIEAKLNLQYS